MQLVWILVAFMSAPVLADDGPVTLTGKPHFVRTRARSEVFFSDLKDSYSIQKDDRHNALLSAFEEAAQKGQSISFSADPKLRRVLELKTIKPQPPPSVVDTTTVVVVPVREKDPFEQLLPMDQENGKK